LRKYRTEPQIWDGDPACVHEWETVDTLRKATPGDVPSAKSILRTSNNGTGKSTLDCHYEKSNYLERNRENSELRPGEPSGFCMKCGAWRGHLGLEPEPGLYIKHLCDIFSEIYRVLRDDGTCWVNMGDSYGGSGGAGGDWNHGKKEGEEKWRQASVDVPAKCLTMIPERFAMEMVRRGWILRQKIVWRKPSCMPSSVTDRFTSCWEPLYFFSKSQKYWFEQQFTEQKSPKAKNVPWNGKFVKEGIYGKNNQGSYDAEKLLGANMRDVIDMRELVIAEDDLLDPDVLDINTSKTREKHFATYPKELCLVPIKAGCPKEICTKCGEPRYPVVKAEGGAIGADWKRVESQFRDDKLEQGRNRFGPSQFEKGADNKNAYKRHLDYTSCSCGAPFVAGIVLDPFFGTGTTAVAAIQEHRNWVGIELSPEYITFSEKRLSRLGCEIGSPEKKRVARKARDQNIGKLDTFVKMAGVVATAKVLDAVRSNDAELLPDHVSFLNQESRRVDIAKAEKQDRENEEASRS